MPDTYKVDDVVDRAMSVLVGEAGPDESLDREVRWALQAAQLELVNEINPHAFRVTTTIDTVTDQAEYEMPDDFKAVIEDTVFRTEDKIPLREFSEQLYRQAMIVVGESSGTPEHYFMARKSKSTGTWIMFLSPTPDEDDVEISLTYRSMPAPVWNTTRGEANQLIDTRFPPEFIPLLVHGIIACGHFSRYLNAQDLVFHTNKWQDGIKQFKRNNDPVVGKASHRGNYPNKPMNVPWGGGVHPAWWGGQVS